MPPLPEPFLTESEREAALAARAEPSVRSREAAEKDLLDAMAAFAASGELAGLYQTAREHALAGRIEHMSANALYEIYLYPNDEDEANARYQGRPVVLTGRVAPHNMTDAADGFKLFEQTPYAHEPVLLETEQELVFVRCRLARPEIQKLQDWQEIHILGVVAGKDRGDVVLDDCVVLEG